MITPEFYQKYLDNLLLGNRGKCNTMIQELINAKVGVKSIYTQIFQQSLYEVGTLWEQNKISVSHEHLSTAITESLMSLFYPILFQTDHLDKNAIVACTSGEFHQIGAKMVADIFELNRWNAFFVGAGVPLKDLLTLIDEKEPDVVALSLSVVFNFPILEETIAAIHKRFGDLSIIVGGQAFNSKNYSFMEDQARYDILNTLDDLETFIQTA